MRSLALFNAKGGVGKTTLAYHIGHMLARRGHRTVLMDYDPQANLTGLVLGEDELEELWWGASSVSTVARCLEPVRLGTGEPMSPRLRKVDDRLWLLPGELALARLEQAPDVLRALDALNHLAAARVAADVLVVDVGPGLGTLNRAVLLVCDAVVVPLTPDMFSLQGLETMGSALEAWRTPTRDLRPMGYIAQHHLGRVERPITDFERWAHRVPPTYRRHVLGESGPAPESFDEDEHCLFTLRHMASLAPLAQRARKPIFDLKQADGVGGGQVRAVARCRREFHELTSLLAERLGLPAAVPLSVDELLDD